MTGRYALALAVAAVACGGEKPPVPERAASVPPVAADSPVTPVPAVKAGAADSAAAKRKSESSPLLRDSAFGPKAEVDEHGNVKPIPRP